MSRWHEPLITLDGLYFDGKIFTRNKKYAEQEENILLP